MRIAITTATVHDNFRSGLLEYIQRLVENLANVDVTRENRYFIFIPKIHLQWFSINKENVLFIFIPEFYCSPLGSLIWHLLVYPFYLLYYHIDIVHLPEYRRPLLFSPCKVIMTVHDLIGFNVPGHFLSLKRRLLHMFILKMMRLSVDKYIAVSMNTKRDIVNFVKVPPEKISVIYEAVSEGFKPRKNSEISGTFLKKYNLKKNYILYVARIEHPLKNHVTLIKALRVLKNEKFEISCVFIGRLYRRYEIVLKMIDEMDLGDNISVIGYVGDEDCHLFYNAATLVVFPSLYEGFGFPVLEAYASGKPIICSNISSLPELACTEEMMFDPLNENEIATKIKMFLTNKELRDNQLAKQEEKLKKFNWVLTAKETLNEYQNCLNKRKFKARSYCE